MTSQERGPVLSVVLPVCNEQDNLGPLLTEISDVFSRAGLSFEVIAVDDGSTDASPDVLRDLARTNPWLRVLLLRRNFGQSAALDAGLKAARGELIATLDADGQNDPADLPRLVQMLREKRADLVCGWRVDRKDVWLSRRMPSVIANALIRRVTGTRLHDLGCSVKVFKRDLVSSLNLYGEMHRFLGVLLEYAGAKSVEVPVNHRRRRAGQSKYGLERTVKVLLDLVTVWFMQGYATKPIYIFGGGGIVLGTLSVLVAGFVLYEKFANGVYAHRNPLLTLAVMLAVIAVQFLVLGLLAEILVRTYFESRGRPGYHVREAIDTTRVQSEPDAASSIEIKSTGDAGAHSARLAPMAPAER